MKKTVLLTILLLNLLFTACSGQTQGTIKGNINDKGEKIYHMPGQRYYDVCKPEKVFSTEEEAKAAGFRKSKV